MKKRFKYGLRAFVASVVSALLLTAVPVYATPLLRDPAAVEYEVIFLAGSQGSIDGAGDSLRYSVAPGGARPDQPDVTPVTKASGGKRDYTFVGWDKAYPARGQAVNGSETYVAQYAVLVDGVEYAVQYIDTNGTELLAPKYRTASNGQKITESSKTIAGYTVEADVLTMTLQSGKSNVLQFVYKADSADNPGGNDPEPDRVVSEVIREEIVYVPGENPGNTGGGAGGNTDNPEASSQVNEPGNTSSENETIEDPDTPLAGPESAVEEESSTPTEIIEDPESPLAKPQAGNTNAVLLWSIGGVAALLAAGIVIFLVLKRKKNAKQ